VLQTGREGREGKDKRAGRAAEVRAEGWWTEGVEEGGRGLRGEERTNLTSSTNDSFLHRFEAVDSTIEVAFDEIDLG